MPGVNILNKGGNMRIFPTSNNAALKGQASFKGKYEIYHGQNPIMASYKDYHSDSSVERIIGNNHDYRTGRIYFADPMEPINDQIKRDSDYIVYDNEPAYPDVNNEVSKNYFGTERINYREKFENIRDYFYRREQAGWADKAEAQYQQWQAAECIRLYDQGGHLRYQKETLEDKISNLNDKIKQSENSINLTKMLIEEKEAELNALKNPSSTEENLDSKDAAALTGLAGATAVAADNKSKISALQGKIKNLKMRLGKLNKDMNIYKSVVETESPKISEIKAKLIPLFDNLKNFYAKQGIKKF